MCFAVDFLSVNKLVTGPEVAVAAAGGAVLAGKTGLKTASSGASRLSWSSVCVFISNCN